MSKALDIYSIEKKCFRISWSESSIEAQLSHENSICHVVYENNVAVGFVLGQFVLDECELLRIAVLDEYRKKGFGNQLMELFLRDCEKLAIKKIFLEVRETNEKAICLYRKFGFEQIALRKNYYSMPSENALVFTRCLG